MSNHPKTLDNGPVPLLAACVLMSGTGDVFAQADNVGFGEPPLLKAQVRSADRVSKALRSGTNLLTAGAESEAIQAGNEIYYILPIKYTDGTINNPATGKLDAVNLRSYGDRFLAPTIVMKPGQTVRISLSNRLPEEPDCAKGKETNEPHCFNTTNLHSHGLWVSPTGNSDNVLLSIKPNVDFEYVYNVPEDHPTGTFWYHPHKHGSTTMQVGSGMAGVLVVEGDRPPTPQGNGDLDTLLRPFEPTTGGDYVEVMLLQQIPYACFDDKGNIEKDSQGRWICNDRQEGVVKDFNAQFGGPGVWANSGRYTLINGVARPELVLESGRVYRWRLVHSGVTNSIALRIRKIRDLTLLRPRAASSKDRADEVQGLCTGTDVTQFEVAADGLTRGQVFGKTTDYLQPGYRSDVLFVLPEEGSYCVYDDAVPAEASVTKLPEDANVLAIITAKGGRAAPDQKVFLTEQLLTAADRLRAEPKVKAKVKTDLRNDLRLSSFVPHPDVTNEEIAKSALPVVPIDFGFNDEFTIGEVNGCPYEPARIDQTLILGGAQSWRLSSSALSHPFHIHVNPFQIVSVRDKITKKEKLDGEYEGMKGVWKDTIFVEGDPNGEDPQKGVVIETRTRYARWIGEFVLHCHILNHEDTGMMQNVEVVLSGTEPARPDATPCPPPKGGH